MDRITSVFGVANSSPPHASWPGPKDPDDDHLFVAAKRCGARYVVSQNTADFPPIVASRSSYDGVEYLTYENMLRMIGRTQTELLQYW